MNLNDLANRIREAIGLESAYLLSPALTNAPHWRSQLERLVEVEDPGAACHALQR